MGPRFHQIALRARAAVLAKWQAQYAELVRARRLDQEMEYWRSHKAEVLRAGEQGYRAKIDVLGLSPENLQRLQGEQRHRAEVVVADIDGHGRLLSHHGPIQNAPAVLAGEFVERKRFKLYVVAHRGYAAVRKIFRDCKRAFLNELRILYYLGAEGCRVPGLMDVDFDEPALTMSYIPGRLLRHELTRHGAQLQGGPDGAYGRATGRRAKRHVRAEAGKRVLRTVVGEEFIDKLYAELCKMHAAGVIGIDIHYGNIIIESETGEPYWIDFDHSTYHPQPASHLFQVMRSRDIERFNLFFGTSKTAPETIADAGTMPLAQNRPAGEQL